MGLRQGNKTGVFTHQNTDGTTMTEYWKDGCFHRDEDEGPAVIFSDGTQEYWIYGMLHRRKGPAIIYTCGRKLWYLYSHRSTAEEVFDQLTDEEKEEAIWSMDEWR